MTGSILWVGEPDPSITELLRREVPAGYELIVPDRGIPTAEQLNRTVYILNGAGPVSAELMRSAPNLRLVQRLGVGLDGVDLDAAQALNVAVANLPALNTVAVAEHTMLLTLACARHLCALHDEMVDGRWTPNDRLQNSFELHGKTLGIVGLGNIGREVAQRAHAFGMVGRYFDTAPVPDEVERNCVVSYAPLDELLAISDILSIHVPATSKTTTMLGYDELACMKPGAVLVNTSRSGVVDDNALSQHLQSGHLGAAALDVWSSEPARADDPLVGAPNVIATPHVGAQTVDTVLRSVRAAIANIDRDRVISRSTTAADQSKPAAHSVVTTRVKGRK